MLSCPPVCLLRICLLLGLSLAAPRHALAAVPAASDKPAEPRRERSAKDYDPNTPLVSHQGQTLRFYDDVIKGRIVLINTMFTSCAGICPPITNNLLAVQKALSPYLGKQVVMVSITVDPQTDTPAVLKAYVERYAIGPGWLFLTGKPAHVDAVLAKLGDTDPEKTRHSGMLLIGDESGKSWRKVPAMSAPKDIASAIEKLLARKASSLPPTAETR